MFRLFLLFFVFAVAVTSNTFSASFKNTQEIKENPEGATQFFDSLRMQTQTSDSVRCRSFLFGGYAYHQLGDVNTGNTLYQEGLNLAKELKDSVHQLFFYQFMVRPLFNEGKYVRCYELALEYEQLSKMYGDSAQWVKALLMKSSMLYYLERREEAFQVQQQVYGIAHMIKDSITMSQAAANISAMYAEKSNTDSSLHWFQRSVAATNPENKSKLAMAYALSSVSMQEEKYFKKREAFLDTALTLARQGEDSSVVAFVCIKTATFLNTLGKSKLARKFAKHAIDLYTKERILDGITHALGAMVQINESENNLTEVINDLRYIQKVRDTLYSLETADKVAEFKTKFETAEKERENLLLKKENAEKQLRLAEERRMKNLIGGGAVSVVLLILLLSVYFFYNHKLKHNERLNKLEQERFKAVLSAEENERMRIARELHDGLGQLLSTAKMNVSAIEEAKGVQMIKRIDNSVSLLDSAVQEVRSISHNLMPATLMRIGFKAALLELAERINESQQIVISVSYDIPQGIKLPSKLQVSLYRIVQEVVNNALKHSQAKEIKVSLALDEKKRLKLLISDNGIGFDTDSIEESKGIGWKNIFTRIAMLGGEINVESKRNSGSNIFISFPLID